MKVLVTGSEGYIGKELKKYLTTLGNEIICYDKKINKNVENIHSVHFCDAIVHLAAIAGVSECEEDKDQAVIDNIIASSHIFKLAYKNNKPLIFASSQAAKKPTANFYATTKYIAEQNAFYLNGLGADIRILRFTNIYGGDMNGKNSVIANFTEACKNNKDIIVNGDGNQVRDFIHIQDICKAIFLALQNKGISEPIDIGTGIGTRIIDLAKMFKNIFTITEKYDKVGISYNVADTLLAKNLLGFRTSIKLEDFIYMLKGENKNV